MGRTCTASPLGCIIIQEEEFLNHKCWGRIFQITHTEMLMGGAGLLELGLGTLQATTNVYTVSKYKKTKVLIILKTFLAAPLPVHSPALFLASITMPSRRLQAQSKLHRAFPGGAPD